MLSGLLRKEFGTETANHQELAVSALFRLLAHCCQILEFITSAAPLDYFAPLW
ncbi:MAG: hypothetical protein LBL83_08025 [Clostridiales bacterium]|nr:hypothetical protein [Clostridiales bacterium]